MVSGFIVRDHVIDASHVREFPNALRTSQEDVLKLAIKEYIPKNNTSPKPGDVTLVGAHANGFPKELYEPLWEDLLARSAHHNFRIRSVIIADAAWQGRSGVLNEAKLGNDPSWLDYPRDMLHMINTLRPPLPLVGVGHSFGGNGIANLSLMHPRLFAAIVLLDPVISKWSATAKGTVRESPAAASAYRRDRWPSRAEARASFRKSPFYRGWDPRVLDAWVEHGLREVPARHPGTEAGDGASGQSKEQGGGPVVLTTTRHQEVFTYLRPSWEAYDADGKTLLHPEKVPDLDPSLNGRYYTFPFYRSEGSSTLDRLPNVRPGVLYVFGETSDVSTSELREEKMRVTGAGVGGSGGRAKDKVREVLLKGAGHLFPMEVPGVCADAAAEWIEKEIKTWREEQKQYEAWRSRSEEEKTTITDEWRKRLGRPERPGKGKEQAAKAKI